jgi:hypothetical protein
MAATPIPLHSRQPTHEPSIWRALKDSHVHEDAQHRPARGSIETPELLRLCRGEPQVWLFFGHVSGQASPSSGMSLTEPLGVPCALGAHRRRPLHRDDIARRHVDGELPILDPHHEV